MRIYKIILSLVLFLATLAFYVHMAAGWQDVPDAGPGRCVSGCGNSKGSHSESPSRSHEPEQTEQERRLGQAQQLCRQAEALYNAGRYREALDVYYQASKAYPRGFEELNVGMVNARVMVHVTDARATADTGDYDRAMSIIRQGMSENPEAYNWQADLNKYNEEKWQMVRGVADRMRRAISEFAGGMPASTISVPGLDLMEALNEANTNLQPTKEGLRSGSDERIKHGAMQVFDTPYKLQSSGIAALHLTGAGGKPLPKYVLKDRRVQKAGRELSRLKKELARIEKEKAKLVRRRNMEKDRETMAELTKKVDEAEKTKQMTLYKITRTKIHIDELDRKIEAEHDGKGENR